MPNALTEFVALPFDLKITGGISAWGILSCNSGLAAIDPADGGLWIVSTLSVASRKWHGGSFFEYPANI